jgi:hypothetical protein
VHLRVFAKVFPTRYRATAQGLTTVFFILGQSAGVVCGTIDSVRTSFVLTMIRRSGTCQIDRVRCKMWYPVFFCFFFLRSPRLFAQPGLLAEELLFTLWGSHWTVGWLCWFWCGCMALGDGSVFS